MVLITERRCQYWRVPVVHIDNYLITGGASLNVADTGNIFVILVLVAFLADPVCMVSSYRETKLPPLLPVQFSAYKLKFWLQEQSE